MKDYGYKGEPDTCFWCGKKLSKERATEDVRVEIPDLLGGPPGFRTESRPTGEVRVGYMNDHTFCTQSCGYRYGLAMVRQGRRFAALKG